ncbi:SusD/RagB family nutrient-binding outer membrane lipoprotein [Flavobacterium sp. ANB]|uniref:SusD/RagB family nutrient-binding outer membrane lipoprotein n=1 Tax=unclassified Flavobacterium TaxID=196869 RepID=UPI0012B89901|nr:MULTISPECIES: SusD/RagB family nutrient-binding outer membrane lipoprotein [unclassified Flavobacterium]MBF4516999.1 SusD/RagB family nutrient-binding outer membrane lipoprotein [Flavobacterium sp. ANB]MTD69105.1 SusD/RagB family nutrient-binding outer membrane lipoprotein [Flavobacterium sp. LC2016-13]
MKKIKITAIILLLSGMSISCSAGFEELNDNPNLISEISPGTLLNPIIYGVASQNALQSVDVTFNLMQVSLPFPSITGGLHRYDVSNNIGNSAWNNYYKWLSNIREMRMASVKAGDVNYEAIALTLNALVYANLTDLFGPVPMTEAVRGEDGILYPKYDTQEFIYETILADLERANTLYDVSKPMIYAEDILFQNNVSKWKKFTNSLKMRLLLRVSNRTEIHAFEKLANMSDHPEIYPVFTTTAECAILKVTGISPNVSPWGRPQDFNLNIKMASFFIDNLNTLEDPRRAIIATGATALVTNAPIGFKGITSGYAGADSQFKYNASTLLNVQATNPMQIYILTYAEVEFIKAELAQRGLIADAAGHYVKGVKAAIEQVKATTPATYFDNVQAQYDGTLERIMLQKYYALYFTDYQQWFEYRRTGLPVLPTTTAMLNGGIMPSRFTYPDNQQIKNTENYEEAIQMIGGDNINSKVWWDK